MASVAETVNEAVRLTRHYRATREHVFAAWTELNALAQWFGTHSHKATAEQFDLREGGTYRIPMTPVTEDHDCGAGSNEDSVCTGRFVQILPPQKLVLTFAWAENGMDIGETLLTIELSEARGGSDIDPRATAQRRSAPQPFRRMGGVPGVPRGAPVRWPLKGALGTQGRTSTQRMWPRPRIVPEAY
jgi:uncharacterized protein YndB with AHSA1/START domain